MLWGNCLPFPQISKYETLPASASRGWFLLSTLIHDRSLGGNYHPMDDRVTFWCHHLTFFVHVSTMPTDPTSHIDAMTYLERRRHMKIDQSKFKSQQKNTKPFFRSNPADEKRLQILRQNPKRLRIVQSVSAGHVRGGHSFH